MSRPRCIRAVHTILSSCQVSSFSRQVLQVALTLMVARRGHGTVETASSRCCRSIAEGCLAGEGKLIRRRPCGLFAS